MIGDVVASLAIGAVMLPGLWSVFRETGRKVKASRDFTEALVQTPAETLASIESKFQSTATSRSTLAHEAIPAVKDALSKLPESEREEALFALQQPSIQGRDRYLRRHVEDAIAAQGRMKA